MEPHRNNIDLEIETLLHAGGHIHYSDDTIRSVITPVIGDGTHWNLKSLVKSSRSDLTSESNYSSWWHTNKEFRISRDSESSEELSLDDGQFPCVEVNGADIGDLPIVYTVQGLRPYELPVIGIYVDKRITPGFKYRIRQLGTKSYLFKGKALTLQSVGIGYGKRITLEGDSLINNDNYFYSDTHPAGYGFELVGIAPREKFMVFDCSERPIGKATIDSVESAVESNCVNPETGSVEKRVHMGFNCSLTYESDPHGLMPLCSNNSVHLNGQLYITKSKGEKTAKISAFRDIALQHYGICSFKKC